MLADQSGATSVIGQDTVKSLDIAMRHIAEDGGVLGRKLELKIVDTQGKPDVMRRELERLARLENAPLVLGCEVSAATAAAAQFAEQFKVPYLNSAAAAADILERGYSWYFSDQITGDDEARAVTSFVEHLVAQRAGKPVKFAFLFEDSPRGAGTIDASRKLLKDKGLVALIVVNPSDVPSMLFRRSVKSVLGRPDRSMLEPLVAAFARGEIETLVEERFALSDAEQAHQRSKAGKVVGKLLLIP